MGSWTKITSGGSTTIADGTYNKYATKNGISFGDSITEGLSVTNCYPFYLGQKLQANVINKGSSGSDSNRLRVIVSGGTSKGGLTYTAPDYSNIDFVTIKIGHNCYGVNNQTITSIDGISDFTSYPDNFYGDVCASIEYILSQKQDIKIYLLTPIQSTNSTYITNTKNATDALKIIGQKYATPVINLQHESGLHFRNLSLFTTDGTHLNTNGGGKVAEVVARQMLSY